MAGVQSSSTAGIVLFRCGRPVLRPFKDNVVLIADGAQDADAADVFTGAKLGRDTIGALPCGSPARETGRCAADPKR
jgi:hypothetical protein